MNLKIPFITANPDDRESVENNDGLLRVLNETFDYCFEARTPYLDRALTCLLFLAENQWEAYQTDVSRTIGRTFLPAYGLEKSMITDDQIGPLYQQQLSYLTANQPAYAAVAAPPYDDAATRAAKFGTNALKWRESADKESILREQEWRWTLSTGCCNRRTGYDPSLDNKTGDISTEAVNIFRVLYDPWSTDGLWPPRLMIEYDSWDIDSIEAEFGVKVEPEPVDDKIGELNRLAMNVVTGGSRLRESKGSNALVKRLYLRPGGKYPKGHVFVWAGDKLLKHSDLQGEKEGIWPWARGEWCPIPGRLYPMSFVEALLRPQRDLNIEQSQIAEIRKRRLRGDFVVTGDGMPKQILVSDEDAAENPELLRDGRKMIRMPRDTKFDFMTYNEFNIEEAEMHSEQRRQRIRSAVAMDATRLGQVGDTQTKATATSLADQASAVRTDWYSRRFAEEYQCVTSMIKLALMKDYYVTPRQMNLGPQGKQDEELSFRGADLGDTEEVIAVPVPNLRPAQKDQLVVVAGDKELFGPFETPVHELAARRKLRGMGLVELEEDMAQHNGTFEDLKERSASFQQGLYAIAEAKVQEALAPPPPPEPASPAPTMGPGMMPQGEPMPMMAQPGEIPPEVQQAINEGGAVGGQMMA